jgi:hypothetical protein
MRVLFFAAVLALPLGQPACAKRAAEPTTAASVNTDAPTIKLIDAGTGPKKALRITATKGMKKTLTMTMEGAMSMKHGAVSARLAIPPIELTADLVVSDVATNGDIRCDFTLSRPELVADSAMPPDAVEAMKSGYAGMAGLSGYVVVTRLGFVKEAETTVPAGTNAKVIRVVDTLEQSLRQMSAPVPAEAVGIGARWETTTRVTTSGMSLVEVATIELVSLDRDTMTLKMAIAQSAPPQRATSNGTTIDVLSYQATGSGETTIDATQPVPTSAKVSVHSDTRANLDAEPSDMAADLTVTMTSR